MAATFAADPQLARHITRLYESTRPSSPVMHAGRDIHHAHIGADPGSVNKAYFATEAFASAETAAAGYKRWSDGIAREGKDSLVSPGSAGAIDDQSVFYAGQEPCPRHSSSQITRPELDLTSGRAVIT